MKVIHILHELKFSGAEIMYVDAAPLFQEKGCELTVVATAPNLGEYAPFFEKVGYTIFHKPYPPLKNYFNRIAYYIQFISFFKQNKYDVVHIHSNGAMWGMSLCAWIAGKRSVYTYHNVFPTHCYSYPYHVLLRLSAKHIFKCRFQTISDSVYEHELKLYHNETTKIYNWYGNKRFYPATENEKIQVREELGISSNLFALISIGGCSPIKRHSEIINALPVIIKYIPNILYLHLGTGESEQDEIELAEKLSVSNHIRFCGNQQNVRRYLIAADIYIMPSRFEGISITTIEAMACKIPTMLYDVPGLRDFNKSGENCILIPEDYQLLAKEVISMYTKQRNLDKMIRCAMNYVNSNYSMQKNVDSIFNLYQ